MFYYTVGRLILPSLIQCILNSLVQNGLHHRDICMRNCSRGQCAAVSFRFESFFWKGARTTLSIFGQLALLFSIKVWGQQFMPQIHHCNDWTWGEELTLSKWLQCWYMQIELCTGVASVCAKSLLHAVLSCDGVAVLWVVEERHVDSNERCPIPCEDLTSDYWHHAAWANKHRKGWVNKQCQPASTSGHGINAANNCHVFARDSSGEVWLTDIATQTCHWLETAPTSHSILHKWMQYSSSFIILRQNMQFSQFVFCSVCDGSTENRKAQKLRVKNKHCLANKMHSYIVTEVHFVNEVHKMTNSRHITWDTWGKHSQHCYHSGFTELTIFPELYFQEGVIQAWLFLQTLWLLKCSCCQCQNQVLPSW